MSFSNEEESETKPLKSGGKADVSQQEDDCDVTTIGTVKIPDDLHVRSIEHQKATQQCLSIMRRVRFIGLLLAFDYLMRANIFILYARTLENCPRSLILGIVIYSGYFVSGLFSLINGFIGDMWRFDYLLCIAALCDVITFWIEATATQFTTLAIAYIIGGQAVQSIVFGYLIKMLPVYHAQQYQLAFTQAYIVGALLGPITGGIISYYWSYRMVFMTSAVLATILFLFCIVFIRGTHDKLLALQMPFVSLYNDTIEIQKELKQQLRELDNENSTSNSIGDGKTLNIDVYDEEITDELKWLISDDYKFPTLLSISKLTLMDSDENKDDYDDEVLSVEIEQFANKNNVFDGIFDAFRSLSKHRIFLLVMISIAQAIALSSETSMATWFTVYIEDKYGGTVLLSTGLISLSTFTVLVGSIFVRIGLKRLQSRRDLNAAHVDSDGSGNMTDVVETQKYFFHIQNKYDFRHFLVFWCVVGCVVRIVLSFGIIPENLFGYGLGSNSYEYTFWIYISMIGFGMGMNVLTLGAMLVPIMPHQLTGSVMGLKLFVAYCIKSVGALVVGCLWDVSYDWLWYATGLFTAVCLGLVIVVAFVERSTAVFELKRELVSLNKQ